MKKAIGRRIKEIRKAQGITQIQLSKMSGLNVPNISRIESGKTSTGIDILGKIADALNCRIDLIEKIDR